MLLPAVLAEASPSKLTLLNKTNNSALIPANAVEGEMSASQDSKETDHSKNGVTANGIPMDHELQSINKTNHIIINDDVKNGNQCQQNNNVQLSEKLKKSNIPPTATGTEHKQTDYGPEMHEKKTATHSDGANEMQRNEKSLVDARNSATIQHQTEKSITENKMDTNKNTSNHMYSSKNEKTMKNQKENDIESIKVKGMDLEPSVSNCENESNHTIANNCLKKQKSSSSRNNSAMNLQKDTVPSRRKVSLLSLDANDVSSAPFPATILGIDARLAYCLVRIVWRHCLSTSTAAEGVDWQTIHKLFLRLHNARLLPSECKQLYEYIANSMNSNGTLRDSSAIAAPMCRMQFKKIVLDLPSTRSTASETHGSVDWTPIQDTWLLECVLTIRMMKFEESILRLKHAIPCTVAGLKLIMDEERLPEVARGFWLQIAQRLTLAPMLAERRYNLLLLLYTNCSPEQIQSVISPEITRYLAACRYPDQMFSACIHNRPAIRDFYEQQRARAQAAERQQQLLQAQEQQRQYRQQQLLRHSEAKQAQILSPTPHVNPEISKHLQPRIAAPVHHIATSLSTWYDKLRTNYFDRLPVLELPFDNLSENMLCDARAMLSLRLRISDQFVTAPVFTLWTMEEPRGPQGWHNVGLCFNLTTHELLSIHGSDETRRDDVRHGTIWRMAQVAEKLWRCMHHSFEPLPQELLRALIATHQLDFFTFEELQNMPAIFQHFLHHCVAIDAHNLVLTQIAHTTPVPACSECDGVDSTRVLQMYRPQSNGLLNGSSSL